MSARSQLADAIRAEAPASWTVWDYPTRLRTFADPNKTIAIVIEQRGISADRFSSDGVRIPVEVTLAVWVVVDGSRGDAAELTEDRLEGAVEMMIRILEPLADPVWDGSAERSAYDEQKPAYQFTLRVLGNIVGSLDNPVTALVTANV